MASCSPTGRSLQREQLQLLQQRQPRRLRWVALTYKYCKLRYVQRMLAELPCCAATIILRPQSSHEAEAAMGTACVLLINRACKV